MIFEASDRFGVAPAFELRTQAVEGAPPEHSAMLGLIYVPGEEAEYDIALRLAQSGEDRTIEIRAGLTWQMSGWKILQTAAGAVGEGRPERRRRH